MKSRKLQFSTSFTFSGVSPYSFELTLHKPAGWPLLTPFEIFEGGLLWTVMGLGGRLFGLKLSSVGTVAKPEIHCVLYSDCKLDTSEKSYLKETLAWVLSLDEDLGDFYGLSKHDPLVEVVSKDLYGMRSTNDPNLFSALILAVTLQMAPISRSNQMMQLLVNKYGETARFDGKKIPYWPFPEKLASIEVEELQRECKLGYRAKVLRGIAEELTKGFPSARELEAMSADEAKEKLMELKGIGEYSAEIVSPHEGFPLDVWSAKIFSFLLHQREAKSPRDEIPKLKEAAEKRWGEWRGYVFVYVLNDLDKLSSRFGVNLTAL
jgi:DNA-3-methyladenine glycosylase II